MVCSMKKGFTLTELLMVISIIALLMGILLPVAGRARLQARIVAVNAELRQIGICLDMYMNDNNRKAPPTRKDCTLGWEDHQLPPELVDEDYLPTPATGSGMSAGIADRFHHTNTYKYCSVGELYQNGRLIPKKKASLYVPKEFPNKDGTPETDVQYNDLAVSPVTWVIYSEGPDYDEWEFINQLHGPVPKRTWYSQQKRKGLIVRMELKKGNQTGSFEN